uniref:Uncharacterized protein n=1 Tax=Arundo donax TaxID=35708 RepID=A0A0A9U1N0_ARUDO
MHYLENHTQKKHYMLYLTAHPSGWEKLFMGISLTTRQTTLDRASNCQR